MAIRIAINGYGRIGRNILRALYESGRREEFKIVAINDLGDPAINAHLTEYDTTHGHFKYPVKVGDNNTLVIDGDVINVVSQRQPQLCPWKAMDIDIVFECTGIFTSREKASFHLEAGAKKVLISAPAGSEVDATVVFGVNHKTLKSTDKIVSNASCTTNCLAPLVKPLHEHLGVVNGLMTTIHAYTNDQSLLDVYHTDVRRARAAGHSMIPTKTGAASAVGLVLPELNGKLDGFAMRVPVMNVSVVDLTFTAERVTSVAEVNKILLEASQKELKGILGYTDAPLVSIDFNHNPASSIYDASQTRVMGTLVKVLSWYDNEWAFSNRMLDTAKAMSEAS